LKTALLDGKKPAKFDKDIIRNILLDQSSEAEVRKEKMIIGLRNEQGDIYRVIGAAKPNNFMNAVEELEDLGLEDELHDEDGPRDGYDAIFGEP
jgi:hypothetical protein